MVKIDIINNFITLIASIGSLVTLIVMACKNEAEGICGVLVLIVFVVLSLVGLGWKNVKSWKENIELKIDELTKKSSSDVNVEELSKLKSKLKKISASVASIEKLPADFKREKTELDNKLAGYDSSIKKITEEIATINKEYVRRFDKIESSLEGVSAKNEELEEKLAKLEEILNRLNEPEGGVRRVLTIEGVEFAFRFCPSSELFMMGSPENEVGRFDNETQHNVTIGEGFWICETPTTQKQWEALGFNNNSNFKGAERPVERVSKDECDAFVRELNKRNVAPEGWQFALPTEEQWEYACRAGTTGATYGVPLDDCAWYGGNSNAESHNVGLKTPNKWEIFDMLGNVWELTCSKYKGRSSFVRRGGGWSSHARYCRPADCGGSDPTDSCDDLGFRISLVRSKSK